MDSLDELIERMRVVGEQLVPYNFPQADQSLENHLNPMKTKEVVIDGYTMVLHYSKACYGEHYMETLQIIGKNSPFLPFNLVAKLAKRFLGAHHLALIEVFRDNRKIYCWTAMVDERGCPIPPVYEIESHVCTFEGMKYNYMDPRQVNFY
jgi:hypothetical protein